MSQIDTDFDCAFESADIGDLLPESGFYLFRSLTITLALLS